MVSSAPITRTHLELNLPNQGEFGRQALRPRAKTASVYFAELFPDALKQYGAPFVEIRDVRSDGQSTVTPVSINVDFFAAALGGDRRLGHSVVYYEPEMAWYYMEPHLQLYKTSTSDKLMNLYRGLLQRAAQELPKENNVLNLCVEFRSDKNAKAVVNRAKSILAADASFFSATSANQRIRGPELHERLMRVSDLSVAVGRTGADRPRTPRHRTADQGSRLPGIEDHRDLRLRRPTIDQRTLGARTPAG